MSWPSQEFAGLLMKLIVITSARKSKSEQRQAKVFEGAEESA